MKPDYAELPEDSSGLENKLEAATAAIRDLIAIQKLAVSKQSSGALELRIVELLDANTSLVLENRRLRSDLAAAKTQARVLTDHLVDLLTGKMADPETIERTRGIVMTATENQCGYGMACVPIGDIISLLITASLLEEPTSSAPIYPRQ